MNLLENIKLKGHFSLKVYDIQGNLVEEYHKENLVVTTGKTAMARLLGGSVTGRSVTQIGFGENGAAPVVGDTALTNSYVKGFDGVSYPDATSVLFTWSLGYAEGNGKNIQEFGLLCANNDLFARRNRAVIAKTSDLRFEGTWKIQF
jgi:hypothetical protein